ncbi:MAG: tRNA uridine-5-carboxymethylaminomethyl(34) synthesis GTPase MnmE, partial [Negativicutes bacterium]
MQQEETISAVATPLGSGGIGIVRLSGKGAVDVADRLFRPRRGGTLAALSSFRAVYGDIVAEDGSAIDEGIALVMRGPCSYTKEDVVEIQCHGGSVVLRRVLALTLHHGARLAEPG